MSVSLRPDRTFHLFHARDVMDGLLMQWNVPIELTETEAEFVSTLRNRSKFYVFLRRARHLVLDDELRAQLSKAYSDKPRGVQPLQPAMMLMVVLLQAYTQASDAEAVELSKCDDRWKLVLNTLGSWKAPFSQKTLATFRSRLVEHDVDKVLIARTVELAKELGVFDPKAVKQLKVAVDSASLEGAGRVEDTINLIAHATQHVLVTAAFMMETDPSALASRVGLRYIGDRSVKALLDLDWSREEAKHEGLRMVLSDAVLLEAWIRELHDWLIEAGLAREPIERLNRLIEQDTEPDPNGPGRRLKQGVAPEREISIHDPEMRHGRKSKTKRIDGYKRYVSVDVSTDVILAACVLPANVPESFGADKLAPEVNAHGEIARLDVDRAFLASELTKTVVHGGGQLVARAYPTRNPNGFPKSMFKLDLESKTATCPMGVTVGFTGTKATFPKAECTACEARSKCQKPNATRGRAIQIHQDEQLQQQLRRQEQTAEGRERLRERVTVEHSLAHLCARQGPRARYLGVRKNDFDVRRTATVVNLFTIARKADPSNLAQAEAA